MNSRLVREQDKEKHIPGLVGVYGGGFRRALNNRKYNYIFFPAVQLTPHRREPSFFIDPTADLISVLKLRVLGELWFFAEAG